jgi:hypothetical protein
MAKLIYYYYAPASLDGYVADETRNYRRSAPHECQLPRSFIHSAKARRLLRFFAGVGRLLKFIAGRRVTALR